MPIKGTYYRWTLGAAPTFGATGLSQLGGTNTIISGSTASTSTTTTSILATIPIPSAGYWLITGTIGSNGNTVYGISGNTTLDIRYVNTVVAGFYGNISSVFLTTSASSLYLIGAQTGAVYSVSPIWIFATRIGQTLGAAPTTNGHLGYNITANLAGAAVTSGSAGTIATITLPQAGIWYVNYNYLFYVNGVVSFYNTYMTCSNSSYTYATQNFPTTNISINNTMGSSGSAIIVTTNNTTTVSLMYNHTFTGTMSFAASAGSGASLYQYVRIGQTLGAAPTAGSTGQLGSYGYGTGNGVSAGTGAYQALVTFTNLPIGIYIFTCGMFANTPGFSVNLQIGLAPTTQNANLANMCGFSGSTAQVISFTTTFIQTSVTNVYFSAAGVATYQFIQSNYVRIGQTLGAAPTTAAQLGGITTVTIAESVLTSGDANWKNSPSFGLSAGVYLINSMINTAAGTASNSTYTLITYSISSAPSNNGSSYLLHQDTTLFTTEINGTGNTYAKRNYTRILVIGTSAPTLYFSVSFVYTVGGANAQPSILSSPISFMRIAQPTRIAV